MLVRIASVTAVLLATGAVLLSTGTVEAQFYDDLYPGHHSSTLEEGVQRGYSDVVRSYGMANLLNSQAAKEFEQARRSYIENRLKATQTYFEMRRYNEESRRAMRSTPLSMEQYVRIARDAAPEMLTATQLDPLTGTINWPVPLQSAEFESFRVRIERLFQDRAAGYYVSGDIQRACNELLEKLKVNLETFPANEYVLVKKFVDSLAWAARGLQG